MLDVKTFTSIKDLDSAEWNVVAGNDHLIRRYEYLCAIEESDINDCQYFYPVVSQGGKMVAHACVYFIRTELDVFAQGVVKRLVEKIRTVWKDFAMLKSIECGTPVALGTTVSLNGQEDRQLILTAITREIERLARSLNVGIVLFRDFFASELEFYDHLRSLGYTRIQNLPTSHAKIHWHSFGEYSRAMRSHYRYKMGKGRRNFKECGGFFEVVHDFSSHAPELARLWRSAYDHAKEYRREILLPRFFKRINTRLEKKSFVLLAKRKDEIIGFALCLCDGDTLIWLFCGLDYEQNRRTDTYFNILYKIMEMAIERGFKKVDLGITTPSPKMEIGGEVVPLYMYMKHLSPLLRHVIPLIFQWMTPCGMPAPRRVFKNQTL